MFIRASLDGSRQEAVAPGSAASSRGMESVAEPHGYDTVDNDTRRAGDDDYDDPDIHMWEAYRACAARADQRQRDQGYGAMRCGPMAVVDDEMYVFGGRYGASQMVEKFDGTSWTRQEKGLQGRFALGGSVVVN